MKCQVWSSSNPPAPPVVHVWCSFTGWWGGGGIAPADLGPDRQWESLLGLCNAVRKGERLEFFLPSPPPSEMQIPVVDESSRWGANWGDFYQRESAPSSSLPPPLPPPPHPTLKIWGGGGRREVSRKPVEEKGYPAWEKGVKETRILSFQNLQYILK